MKIDKRNPRHWLLLFEQGLFSVLAAGARHWRKRPQRPLVVLYGHQLSGNLRALYDEWQARRQQDFTMAFLSLDPEYSEQLKQTGVHVLQCHRLADMLTVGRASAMITDHGLHAMLPLLWLTDIRFIDVWHGIPFKGFAPEDFRVQQRYDEAWVSSPLLKEIYVEKFGFKPERVHALGYARTDKLFRQDTPRDNLHNLLGIPRERRIVLYAPTWQQDDSGRELFPFGETQEGFISKLDRICGQHNATLVIRSHLNASITNMRFNNVVYCSMKDYADTEELLLHTSVLVCDWSSIAFDYLALNRPTIFLDVPPPFKNGFSLGKEFRFGRIVKNMNELTLAIAQSVEDPKPFVDQMSADVKKVTKAVYGEFTGGHSSAFQLERLFSLTSQPDE